ncbi:major capsid protein [Marinobacter sp. CA1]|uniref:major capsid protein n=1 Tax=Marinobacter sp. CA1 TaxID=2817656 RepID=UPI001D07348C|nr:major capsid protein [Marinobacter sp. CA1]UDL05737.1 hypothetical protein J2887_02910 [Marinobacter sp. CA1]
MNELMKQQERESHSKLWGIEKSRFGALAKGSAALASVGMAAAANAASILPADFSTDMDAVGSDITTVGAALIGLAIIAVGIKWVKATFF